MLIPLGHKSTIMDMAVAMARLQKRLAEIETLVETSKSKPVWVPPPPPRVVTVPHIPIAPSAVG